MEKWYERIGKAIGIVFLVGIPLYVLLNMEFTELTGILILQIVIAWQLYDIKRILDRQKH